MIYRPPQYPFMGRYESHISTTRRSSLCGKVFWVSIITKENCPLIFRGTDREKGWREDVSRDEEEKITAKKNKNPMLRKRKERIHAWSLEREIRISAARWPGNPFRGELSYYLICRNLRFAPRDGCVLINCSVGPFLLATICRVSHNSSIIGNFSCFDFCYFCLLFFSQVLNFETD